jgi:ferric-dicitrate binding protein FerR (iron transport regulator)
LPREIHLAGEAFFSVAKQANHQVFKVITKDSCVVEVLGTEFNINQRKSGTKVILETGKIALTVPQADQTKKILLQPQDVAIISAQHKSVEVQKINPRLLTSWRENQLFLDNTPISAIADMLKETYNITLTFPNKNLAKERITGTIASGNVDELLQAIGYVLKLTVTRKGNIAHFEEVR